MSNEAQCRPAVFPGSSRKLGQDGPLGNTLRSQARLGLDAQHQRYLTGGLGRRLGREPKATQRHANSRAAKEHRLWGVVSLATLKKRACNSLKFRVLAACEEAHSPSHRRR
jgi:hypothetical protein